MKTSLAHRGQLTRLSKQMAHLLRHNPPPEMDASGFVPLPALIRRLSSPSVTEQMIRQVVATDAKARYELDDSCTPPRVRAVQGHSVQLAEPLLDPVTDPGAVPLAVHVTSEEGWRGIQSSGELRAMGRTHIHFATEPRHLRRNPWASVLLRLDLRRALEASHVFFRAANGVLLCEGPLPVHFVERVERGVLPDSWG